MKVTPIMKTAILLGTIVAVLVLMVRAETDKYEAGYDDGYKIGCHTAKRTIGPLEIDPDWSDSDYVSGYNDGHTDGVYLCGV